MLTRKIGKLLRGKATPAQLMIACVLGSMIGFVPGILEGPGILITLIVLLAILQANLFLAAIVGLLAKVVSLAILPVTFAVGRVLLDGPTGGLFKALINAPVTALFGFEYYLTTGGLLVGLIFGIICGLIVIRGITAFRKKMASIQEGSERYKKWADKWYVKAMTFVFIGGGAKKKDYKKLMSKRFGNPIRPIGAMAAVLLIGLVWLLGQFFTEPIVTNAVQRGLERANGATVDVRQANLNLREGRLEINGFAMADANDLNTDLLRADRVTADVSARDLLRKRLALDEVVLVNATTGEERPYPGRIVGRPPRPVPPDEDPTVPTPDEKTIEEYIREAEVWKERLAQIRRWLERVSGPEDVIEPDEQRRRETREQRIRREIRESGYAAVRALHLIDEAPTFMVYKLDAEGVRAKRLGEDVTVDIRGRNLSTHPHLGEEAPSVIIESSDDRLALRVLLAHAIDPDVASTVYFKYLGLPADRIAGQLTVAGDRPIRGGTIDVEVEGTYGEAGPGTINLPLNPTLRNVTLAIGGREQSIEELTVPIGVRGLIDNPRITLDDTKLADALVKAGAAELAGVVDEKIGERLDEIKDKLPEGVDEEIRGRLRGLLDGR